MDNYAYPSPQLITPKLVRDALRALRWPTRKYKDLYPVGDDWTSSWMPSNACAPGIVEHYKLKRDYFRDLTIEAVAAPVAWTVICSLWTSRKMAPIRALFEQDSATALEAFATVLCIHLSSTGSPLERLQQMVQRVGVKYTDAQLVAQDRRCARERATADGVRDLLESARVSGERIEFNARALFGTLITHKKEFIRFRYGTTVVTVRRQWLDDARKVMEVKPALTAALAPKHDHNVLSIRWTNTTGTSGGLDLAIQDEVRDEQCTLVDFKDTPMLALAA